MKVAVLGGGVIGVSTAYYLAKEGVDVVLLEAGTEVAGAASYANAGQISPGYSTPWAAPGVPLKALKWMLRKHSPLSVGLDGSWYQLRWMMKWFLNCNETSYRRNKERMMRIAEYSRDCLQKLRAETGIGYEQRCAGTLQLFRDSSQMDAVQKDICVLRECGVPFELLDRDGVFAVEPSLQRASAFIEGGLRLPKDETGDCRLFTQELAKMARSLGVDFQFGIKVNRLLKIDGKISGVEYEKSGERGVLTADSYVVAMGVDSRNALLDVGIDVPVYPVKGYSLTIPLVDPSGAPISTVLDETYKVAITRFDYRIRVGGMAELNGVDRSLPVQRRRTLEMVVSQLFPGGDLTHAEFWTGLRPMTPDGPPIVGGTYLRNLYLNVGHGTLGWTMACGSACYVADLLLGKEPQISQEGLSVNRYRDLLF
jgi:D-amino-acid dehydrogenase